MGTPLYTTDIIPMTSRPTLTVMDDGDYFVILDTSTGKISKILKTNIMTALKITYDNTSGLTADTVQAALDELVVNLGSSDSAILALAGRLDTLEGTGEGSVAKAIDDALEQIETDKTLAVSGMAADAKVTGDKVGELKSAFNQDIKELHKNFDGIAYYTNLFDASQIQTGKYWYIDGKMIATENSEYSLQYIPVNPSKTYSMTSKTAMELCTYDANKTFIERITPSSATNYSFGSGVYFVRLSFYNTAFPTNFMFVEAASLPSVYVPYTPMLRESAMPMSVLDELETINGAFIRKLTLDSNWISYGNYYPNNSGAITSNSNYHMYYFIAPSNMEIWTDDTLYSGVDCNDFHLKLYSGTPFSTETNITGYGRQRKNSSGVITYDTMPKAQSKMKVLAGQYIAIAYYKTVIAINIFANGLDSLPYYGSEKIILNDQTIKKALNAQKPKLKYSVYSAAYNATERVQIYLPAKYGFVNYNLYHCVKQSGNADSWQLGPIIAVGNDLTKRFNLTENGELEFAIKLTGRGDFSGGITHGDELVTNINFFIDGKIVTISDFTEITYFDTLRIVETTNVYDPAGETESSPSTIVIGKHTREYLFTAEEMRLRQSMTWNGAYPVINAYMPMWPAIKTDNNITVTDKLLLDSDYDPITLGSNYNDNYPNAKNCVLYSQASASTQEIDCKWQKVEIARSGVFNISDNGVLNYNKVYYTTVSGTEYTTTENEVWKSELIARIDVSNNS